MRKSPMFKYRLMIRVTEEVHQDILNQSSAQDRTPSYLVRKLIEEGLAKSKVKSS